MNTTQESERTAPAPGALLSALENAQRENEYDYLPESILRRVAAETGEALSRVYSVATFYSFFNLKPQGKHPIVVCRGTACHTRGSLGLLKETADKLGFPDFREDEESSFTTEDKMFSVRTVACFGQCALAPVVSVDGAMYSRMTPARLCALIDDIRRGDQS
ncbi:MAG: NAD(P)H-dependent oxidoreductase subunit E [Spirochaetales bacterium]|nr:NAD(P)H-dependent oxidoreductase subunit E [Spirochaetales bacterium]